jgi:hypothetical protein
MADLRLWFTFWHYSMILMELTLLFSIGATLLFLHVDIYQVPVAYRPIMIVMARPGLFFEYVAIGMVFGCLLARGLPLRHRVTSQLKYHGLLFCLGGLLLLAAPSLRVARPPFTAAHINRCIRNNALLGKYAEEFCRTVWKYVGKEIVTGIFRPARIRANTIPHHFGPSSAEPTRVSIRNSSLNGGGMRGVVRYQGRNESIPIV